MKLGKFVGLALMALTLGLAGQSLAAEPIKIGVYLPLTGPNAFGGQLELEGVQLALKDMPEVLGRPLNWLWWTTSPTRWKPPTPSSAWWNATRSWP